MLDAPAMLWTRPKVTSGGREIGPIVQGTEVTQTIRRTKTWAREWNGTETCIRRVRG